MNRFVAALSRLLRPSPAVAAHDEPDAAADAGDAEGEDERALGCGWFDSSHALQTGLVVREHAGADTLGAELPLASWLELQLSGWRAPQAVMNPL
jgi:hypothetical protein